MYKFQFNLYEFKDSFKPIPNKIILGYRLYDTLRSQIPVYKADSNELISYVSFKGIPIEVDYDNPDKFEVEYMIR